MSPPQSNTNTAKDNLSLELKIISAKDIRYVNIIDDMHAYAVVSIDGGPRQQKARTDVAYSCGTNPTWNHTVKFSVNEELARKGELSLVFKLFSYRISGDRDIGELYVPVQVLLYSNPLPPFSNDNEMKLVTYRVGVTGGSKGTLSFSYRFETAPVRSDLSQLVHRPSLQSVSAPPLGQSDLPSPVLGNSGQPAVYLPHFQSLPNLTLEMEIKFAKEIRDVNPFARMDVYAVVLICDGKTKGKQKAQTPIAYSGGTNPTWNHDVVFSLDEQSAREGRLTLLVKLVCQRFGGDKDIGEVNVPVLDLLSSNVNHNGNAMMLVTHRVRVPNGMKGTLTFSYRFHTAPVRLDLSPLVNRPPLQSVSVPRWGQLDLPSLVLGNSGQPAVYLPHFQSAPNLMLEMEIKFAEDIRDVNPFARMDVYAVVSIRDRKNKDKQKAETPIAYCGGTNPTWNHAIEFSLTEQSAREDGLTLLVKLVCKRLSGDKDIGEVNVPVSELLGSNVNHDGNAMKLVTHRVRVPTGTKGLLSFSYRFRIHHAMPTLCYVYPAQSDLASTAQPTQPSLAYMYTTTHSSLCQPHDFHHPPPQPPPSQPQPQSLVDTQSQSQLVTQSQLHKQQQPLQPQVQLTQPQLQPLVQHPHPQPQPPPSPPQQHPQPQPQPCYIYAPQPEQHHMTAAAPPQMSGVVAKVGAELLAQTLSDVVVNMVFGN